MNYTIHSADKARNNKMKFKEKFFMKKFLKRSCAVITAILTIATFTGCGNSQKEFDSAKEINVVTREEGSGTRDAFIELTGVLEKDENGNKKDNTTVSAVTINSTEAVLTNVTGDKYAIGYVSLGSLKDTVKALKIDGVECNSSNIKDGSYAISRPFNIATNGKVNEAAQDFMDFILSSDGQAIVEKQGYVAVSENGAYNSKKVSGKISVAGSSSVSPVMEKLKESYEQINPDVKIDIQTSDSSAGMTAAMEGTCDIGMASRELKEEESQLTSTQIARDGIAVVVNNENTTDNVSIETIRKIYTGEITSWSDTNS